MAFKQRDENTIRIKVVFDDGSFEIINVTLDEFKVMSADFYKPKSYFKNGKGYPFPEEEEDWGCLEGSFICLEQ